MTKNLNLLGDLGQVSHVFSDKTGTLTANHMDFRRCARPKAPRAATRAGLDGATFCRDLLTSLRARAPPPLVRRVRQRGPGGVAGRVGRGEGNRFRRDR